MKKDQAPARDFTLYDVNGIKITLNLPAALQINQNHQERFTTAPVLHNNTTYLIKSASFVINLDDVKDYSSNVIANVRWWDNNTFDGQQRMTFACGVVEPNGTKPCTPSSPGHSQVRWGTTVSSGTGTESFTFTLDLVSLTIGPLPSSGISDGPIVQIG